MLHERFSRLIEQIDAAALDEARWPGVLREIAVLLGAQNASLVQQNHVASGAQAIAVELDPAANALYAKHYSAINVFRRHSEIDAAYGRCAVTIRPQLRDMVLRSEYYNDFLKPFAMSQLAWMFLHREKDDVVLLNLGRPHTRPAFGSSDLEHFTALMPALMRSFGVSRRLGGLGSARGSLAIYLDMLPQGVVLLDALGRVLHVNRAAAVIAAQADGFVLTGDAPLAANASANRRLQAAIARAAMPGPDRRGSTLMLPRPSQLRPFAVSVCPFGDDDAPLLFRRPSVLLEIRDLAVADRAADEWLAECLDLTGAEARVAALLLSGLDREAIAQHLGIAGNTVRTHLARLMSKTDTHRQTELVRLLGRVAAMSRPPSPAGPPS